MNIIPATSLWHLQRETVQAYLDDLATLAVRHGIVIDGGVLSPRSADTGGYLLVIRSGHLRTYATDSHQARILAVKPRGKRRRSTMTGDIAGITGHEMIRRLRR